MMLLMANDAVIPNEVVDAVDPLREKRLVREERRLSEKHRRYPFAG